jgi:hypothetical protein
MMEKEQQLAFERYEDKLRGMIHTVRDVQVMLDSDLAFLYGVETKIFNQSVKRNIERFPDSFRFRLTPEEYELLRSQIVTSSTHGGRRYLPYAFTEQGVAMLSAVLRSETAIQTSISIINAFVGMRRYLAENAVILHRLDSLERRQMTHEIRTCERFDKVFDALEQKHVSPVQSIFFEGQIFDAYVFVNDLLRQAKRSIVLIDNFVDDSVLLQLGKRPAGVSANILTRSITPQLEQDIKRYNAQYPPIVVQEFNLSHDRFLILDGETVYHIGASLKDLGKKWFAFSRMDKAAFAFMSRVEGLIAI